MKKKLNDIIYVISRYTEIVLSIILLIVIILLIFPVLYNVIKIPILDITLNQFTFYLPLNNDFEGMSCAMGFASSFIDENYSIIHTLYKQKNISSLKIGFAPNRTNTCSSGNVYFGDFPQSIKEQTYKGSCSIKEKIIQWSCEVSMISIGQFKYHITNFSFLNLTFVLPLFSLDIILK